MQFVVGDVTDMSQFESNYYDVLIDKSTIDALLCGDHSFVMTAKMLKEVSRVLKVGGIYFVISYGPPETRIFHLEREFLSFSIKQYKLFYDQETDEDKIHYVSICTKLPDAD